MELLHFKKLTADDCVYKQLQVSVLLYVHDIIQMGDDRNAVEEVKL